jgi:hypothetical protein
MEERSVLRRDRMIHWLTILLRQNGDDYMALLAYCYYFSTKGETVLADDT